ncbi:uncharacterized protein CXorf65 homolog [Tiliqua scincoides]|uniref:uncharacterized protein CXorf65 homolog n=1 Tax=Tiliqua scincoides TaxID=71010 RepID=UPI0034619EB7
MFITLLHGENKAHIFNIHCQVQLLLDGIKKHCGYTEEGEIELADESGQVKNLLQNCHRCAAELLTERETYILLSAARGTRSSEIVFTPLLKDDNIINPKFLAKLANCQDPKTHSARVKSRRTHKKATVDITAAEGLQNPSSHGSRARTPIASPKQSRTF